ncbi:hypothetical protein DHEL01_v207530 [Diaporthe helianthi]|uniref:2EXR domain-containing protein n=1 Tax=Diaporthe helianthi TaxID=158607 RepID=A0A2P5HUZ4_DIAHE|nr:hypothetical protein DHEL01_v207530 [Diaporthe helianthi]
MRGPSPQTRPAKIDIGLRRFAGSTGNSKMSDDDDRASKRSDHGFRPFRTQAQVEREGVPQFKHLPPEIRSKIWQDALPPFGIYTVEMLGREEPMPQQPPAPTPMTFRVVFRLEPVPRDQQDDKLRTRLDTMRAIQSVCSEAAYEVQMCFPTTINCTGGKLRFNAIHDSLSLSDLRCPLGRNIVKRMNRYSQDGVVFADNWHKIPRTIIFNNRALCIYFCGLANAFDL